MKAVGCVFAAFLVCFLLVGFQRGHPSPPGLRDAEKAESRPIEPPAPPVRRGVDPVQIKREADELAKLASAVPVEIDQVTKGEFPKDLSENLKKIEKLAKRLRSEVSP